MAQLWHRSEISASRWWPRCALPLLAAAAVTLAAAEAPRVRDELSRPIETEPAKAAQLAARQGGEVLHMRWKLGGFLGAIAGLFVPNDGDALLTFVPDESGHMRVELLITTPKRKGEYFLYGAEVHEQSVSTSAVWNSYTFKDSHKEREQDVDQPHVIDFASAIYHLRWHPPTTVTRMPIWNGGKIYAAEVEPLKKETRKIDGRTVPVRGYAVRGAKVEGQSSFDDKIFLWFLDNGAATPVEIVGKRGLIRVRFELRDAIPASRPAQADAVAGTVPDS